MGNRKIAVQAGIQILSGTVSTPLIAHRRKTGLKLDHTSTNRTPPKPCWIFAFPVITPLFSQLHMFTERCLGNKLAAAGVAVYIILVNVGPADPEAVSCRPILILFLPPEKLCPEQEDLSPYSGGTIPPGTAPCPYSLTTPGRPATGVALHARTVAHQRVVAAFAAGFAFIALHFRLCAGVKCHDA